MDSVLICMVSELIGPGNISIKFVNRLCSYLGLHGGIALSSYYLALLVSFEALEFTPSEHVIIPALSPQIYINALKSKGIVPLIADVNAESGTILPEEIEKFLTYNPKAIIINYPLGYLPNIEKISQYGIPLIEDITHVIGVKLEDRMCGSNGQITILSVEQENIITCGGGGVVLTSSKKIFERLKEIENSSNSHYTMPDLNASLGLSQLKEIDNFISRRKEIFSAFSTALMKGQHGLLKQKEDNDHGFFSFPVLLKSSMNDVKKYAKKKKIETKQAFENSVLSLYSDRKKEFPNASSILNRCLLFPLYPMLSNKNIDKIIRVLSTLP